MDIHCPVCGLRLKSPDDTCPRCTLAKRVPPVVSPNSPNSATGYAGERSMQAGPDSDVRWSMRMLLLCCIGLVLLLFGIFAILISLAAM